MYDNISLYLDSSEVNDINLLNEVLENGDDITIEQTGISGNGMPYAYISLEGKNNQKLTFKLHLNKKVSFSLTKTSGNALSL